ncbi:GNAT family N-acetyltransferase [Paenibacillus segetis]|nr:GNAT family N-acetyltransferase [Paenibacillus segetis]
MTDEYANLISNWKYTKPYEIYSMDGSTEDISELMNGDYYYALNDANDIVGYVCNGNSARVPGGYEAGIYNDSLLDIGLGLNPNYTGKGLGQDFLTQSIIFFHKQFDIKNFQLVVAVFNERAIKVYERTGFIKGDMFGSLIDGQVVDFIVMRYSLD